MPGGGLDVVGKGGGALEGDSFIGGLLLGQHDARWRGKGFLRKRRGG